MEGTVTKRYEAGANKHRDFSSDRDRQMRDFNKMLKRSTETYQEKKRALDKRIGRKLGGGGCR